MKFNVGGKPHVSGIKFLIDNLLNMPHERRSIMFDTYIFYFIAKFSFASYCSTDTIEEKHGHSIP